jgi:hypothetical protein
MHKPDLADRILAALEEIERRARRSVVRSDHLVAHLMAAEEDVRNALYTLDAQGLVRFTPGFVAGDVVMLQPVGRARRGVPPRRPPVSPRSGGVDQRAAHNQDRRDGAA